MGEATSVFDRRGSRKTLLKWKNEAAQPSDLQPKKPKRIGGEIACAIGGATLVVAFVVFWGMNGVAVASNYLPHWPAVVVGFPLGVAAIMAFTYSLMRFTEHWHAEELLVLSGVLILIAMAIPVFMQARERAERAHARAAVQGLLPSHGLISTGQAP